MTAPRIALVTARAARGTDHDMPTLLAALHAAGADADEMDWDDGTVDWSRFDLALLRSPWDYTWRLPEFLAWVDRVSPQTRLLNPPDVLRWNTDKHYLGELARAGVPVVPTAFVEPGENAAAAVDAALAAHPQAHDFVIKPTVSAGSRDTQRHARSNRGSMVAHAQNLLDANRSVLLQPYLDCVDAHGETALLFFDGEFSHAIRKGPLLRRDDAATADFYAAEAITPRTPAPDELHTAQQVLAAIPFARPLLYARVDLIRDDDGSPRLLELELVEPSVFVEHAEDAAARFANAILHRASPLSLQERVPRRGG